MPEMKATQAGNAVIIENIKPFCIGQTFQCGQCFRFEPIGGNTYGGVAHSKYIEVSQTEHTVVITHTTLEDYQRVWRRYFDLQRDYREIIRSFYYDPHLYCAANYSSGIRVLCQDPWETLCSFIISQNNNIPRIKRIIESLSRSYGDQIFEKGGKQYHAFPTAQTLAGAGVDALYRLGAGFRAKYLDDAASKVVSGEVDLTRIVSMDTGDAVSYLQKIKGVGPKVAHCVLLFAYQKFDCFPIDVWIRRVLDNRYFGRITPGYFGKYAGIAQQYLFYYERCAHGAPPDQKKGASL